jgi:uncharacterized protein GlcG (DUF336 family)
MSTKPFITFAQAQAAMKAMIEKAMQTPDEPVAMVIVDDPAPCAQRLSPGARHAARR